MLSWVSLKKKSFIISMTLVIVFIIEAGLSLSVSTKFFLNFEAMYPNKLAWNDKNKKQPDEADFAIVSKFLFESSFKNIPQTSLFPQFSSTNF